MPKTTSEQLLASTAATLPPRAQARSSKAIQAHGRIRVISGYLLSCHELCSALPS